MLHQVIDTDMPSRSNANVRGRAHHEAVLRGEKWRLAGPDSLDAASPPPRLYATSISGFELYSPPYPNGC